MVVNKQQYASNSFLMIFFVWHVGTGGARKKGDWKEQYIIRRRSKQ
jgi:hypothetical protein